jgi:hypothetical protein
MSALSHRNPVLFGRLVNNDLHRVALETLVQVPSANGISCLKLEDFSCSIDHDEGDHTDGIFPRNRASLAENILDSLCFEVRIMSGTTNRPNAVPLAPPAVAANLTVDQVQTGVPLAPIERIKLFSSHAWEEFIQEWAQSLKSEYHEVVRCGGSGDRGRDVIGYVDATQESPWDNYQCKQYDHPLYPGDVWIEIAKLCYHSHRGEYSWPRNYYFVAPQGPGTTLHGYLRKPQRLKEVLIGAWDASLSARIAQDGSASLTGSLADYVTSADFGVFKALSPLIIIEGHRKTAWFPFRFGGGLPPLPDDLTPPAEIAAGETRYVRQLLGAYGDHLATTISTVDGLNANQGLREHFDRARQQFYIAETLRNFSRDTLQPGEYERLQNEFYSGIVDTVHAVHADGYVRVIETIKVAQALQVTSHPLVPRLKVGARGGICHQLANEDKVQWVP